MLVASGIDFWVDFLILPYPSHISRYRIIDSHKKILIKNHKKLLLQVIPPSCVPSNTISCPFDTSKLNNKGLEDWNCDKSSHSNFDVKVSPPKRIDTDKPIVTAKKTVLKSVMDYKGHQQDHKDVLQSSTQGRICTLE